MRWRALLPRMRSASPLQKRPIQTSRQAQTHTDEREPATASIRPRPSLTGTNLGPGPDPNRDLRRVCIFIYLFFLHFFIYLFEFLCHPPSIYIFVGAVLVPQSTPPTPPPPPHPRLYLWEQPGGRTFWTMEDELTAAAAKGAGGQVGALLGAGAQVNGVNRFGRTALQVSVTVSDSCRRRCRWGSPSFDR